MPRNKREHQEQVALMQEAAYRYGKYPELWLLYAIPNAGAYRRKDLQLEGVKSGVPDLHLPVARGNFHSLYIEMKWGRNKLSPTQKVWKARLENAGHRVVVCYSEQAAMDELIKYIKLGAYKCP